jgi:hypothetical protein
VTLRYTIRPIPGQQSVFTERGAGAVFRKLGTRRGRVGRFTFVPSQGGKRRRSIVAEVIENGLPRTTITVARFTVAPVPPLSKPKHLTARRKATTLTISWSPVVRARTYLIKVFQGRALIATTLTSHHALRLVGVPAKGRLGVTVQPLGPAEQPGQAARATAR